MQLGLGDKGQSMSESAVPKWINVQTDKRKDVERYIENRYKSDGITKKRCAQS